MNDRGVELFFAIGIKAQMIVKFVAVAGLGTVVRNSRGVADPLSAIVALEKAGSGVDRSFADRIAPKKEVAHLPEAAPFTQKSQSSTQL